jgi:hypothetical protein
VSFTYLIYQAERPRSAAEQRAEDTRRGELAMALSRVLRGRHATVPAVGSAPAEPAAQARPALTVVRAPAAYTVPAPRVAAPCENRTAC